MQGVKVSSSTRIHSHILPIPLLSHIQKAMNDRGHKASFVIKMLVFYKYNYAKLFHGVES